MKPTELLTIPASMSWEQWTARVRQVGQLRYGLPWYIGDLLNVGEERWGDRCWQEINELGYNLQSCRNFKWVASRIGPDERSGLDWSYYQAIAGLEKEQRAELITLALSGHLTRAEMRVLAAQVSLNGGKPVLGSETAQDRLPTQMAAAIEAAVLEIRTWLKLAKRVQDGDAKAGPLLKEQADVVIASLMAARERL